MDSANGSAPFVRITVKEETGTMISSIINLVRLKRKPTTAQLLRRKAGGHLELESHLTQACHDLPHRHFLSFCERTPDGNELYAAFMAFASTNQGATFVDFVRSVVQT